MAKRNPNRQQTLLRKSPSRRNNRPCRRSVRLDPAVSADTAFQHCPALQQHPAQPFAPAHLSGSISQMDLSQVQLKDNGKPNSWESVSMTGTSGMRRI